MTSADESRPAGNEAAIKITGGRSENHSTSPVDHSSGNVLEEWPRSRMDDYWTGWFSGYLEGIDRGRELADAEWNGRQRASARIVHRMAELPPRDADADRARRARIDARWSK